MDESRHHFQVNLTGLIDLLSNHLYSNPGVFIRELLQNGVDAITARKKLGHAFAPHIHVETYSNHTISIQDNGIGLTRDEMIRFLASIGSTTKKDPDGADDFIGQFGVGLLSCFIVSDEIVLLTRSALEGESLEWKGRPDGTYEIRMLDREVPIGTTVYLKAKPEYEELFGYWQLKELLEKYGKYLNVQLTLLDEGVEETIHDERLPWKLRGEEAAKFVEESTGSLPLDIIPLASELGGLEGFAAILPYSVNVQEKKRHHVYLKNMLLSDENSDLLPDWAFFVDAYVNATNLKPTASRESFQKNDLFDHVREELGERIKEYFKRIAAENRELLERIMNVHYQSIKLVANDDWELYRLFSPWFRFETSYGEMDMASIMSRGDRLYVTATVDEFRQIARVARAQDMLVVNGGYQYDFGLLTRANIVWEDAEIEVVDVMKFSNRFTPLTAREEQETRPFLEMAREFLARHRCEGVICFFEPADVPVLYTTNKDINYLKIVNESMEIADGLFADLLGSLKAAEFAEEPLSRLCFNYNNPIIRKVVESGDATLQRRAIELFYTQSLLMGNHAMSNQELRLMNESLFYFMNLGLDRAGELRG
jgi:molecular chaperone HtpG